MKITIDSGMVTIDDAALSYGNIEGMYKGADGKSQNGGGLQLNKELEHKSVEINNVCDSIANSIYRLQALLRETNDVIDAPSSSISPNADVFIKFGYNEFEVQQIISLATSLESGVYVMNLPSVCTSEIKSAIMKLMSKNNESIDAAASNPYSKAIKRAMSSEPDVLILGNIHDEQPNSVSMTMQIANDAFVCADAGNLAWIPLVTEHKLSEHQVRDYLIAKGIPDNLIRGVILHPNTLISDTKATRAT